MKRKVIIVTTAYGYQEVRQQGGQQALLALIAAAGADGVEIRRELLNDSELSQLIPLGQAIASHRLTAVYSVPEPLFMADGSLNPSLEQRFQEAEQLQAQRLKLSLGHYRPDRDNHALMRLQSAYPVSLVVENDQTECGTLSVMQNFFHEAGERLVPGGMTFDMANWQWVGDEAHAAAAALSRYVSYIHVKAATPHQDSWRAVPPDESDPTWRELLRKLPVDAPCGIEFPLRGENRLAVTHHYVNLLREALSHDLFC